MIRSPISQRRRVVLGVVAMILLALGYTWMSYRQHKKNPKDTTIPTWSQFGEGIHKAVKVSPATMQRWQDAKDSNPDLKRPRCWLVADTQATGTRLFLGIGIGVVGSLILGLLMGMSRTIEAFLLPPIAYLAKFPPTAALPVFFVLVGTNLEMFTTMIVFGILPTMSQSVYLAARDISEEYFHKAYTLGSSTLDAVCHIMLPFVWPKVLDAVRLTFGPAIVYLIAAEMLCSDVGFGYRIRLQARLLNMNIVYPYLVLLATFTFAMDYGIKHLQKKTCSWYIREEGM